MAIQLPPQSVYDGMQKSVEQAKSTGKELKLDLNLLAEVADLHQEGPNEKGPIFKFTDNNNIEHSLSVKDFQVAGGIFKGLDLQTISDKKATVIVGDNMDAILASLPKLSGSATGKLGKSSEAAGNVAKGEVQCRIIKVTDGDPIKVYGSVSPKAEALIADGWLSDNDMHALQQGNKGWEYSGNTGDVSKNQATRTMSLLYQRQIDKAGTVFGGENYTGGHFNPEERKNQRDTFQAMKTGGEYIDNAFVSGHEGSGAKGKFEVMTIDFDRKLPASSPPSQDPVQLVNARSVLSKIDKAPTIAPEDKAYLKQMVFLKYVVQVPTDVGRKGPLGGLPTMKEANEALKEMGVKVPLDKMLNSPEKYTLQLQQLAQRLDIPTSM